MKVIITFVQKFSRRYNATHHWARERQDIATHIALQGGPRGTIPHDLWRQLLQTPKTEAVVRTLHIPRELVDVLCAHREQSKWAAEGDFLFARTDGTPYDADHLRRVVLYPAMDRCRIAQQKWTHGFHVFRHTAGSIVHAQTGDLKLAQELLGHSRISTTSDIYIHMPENVAAQATEILAREITRALGSERVQ